MKRFLSLLLVITGVLAFFPALVFGVEEAPQGEVVLKVGAREEPLPADRLSGWISSDPTLEISTGYRTEIENASWSTFGFDSCWLDFAPRESFILRKNDRPKPDWEAIREFARELAARSRIEPVDGRFRMENGRVVEFAPSQTGSELDVPEAAESLEKSALELALSGIIPPSIELPIIPIPPEIKSSDLENLGIISLIGEGKSNFAGSPKNRIFNIRVATERFNGILIKPGEDFSFVETLGPVDGEHGYLPELVIKKDKTEPEFGGGICQVSTTAFRAAIYSGLKITARRNHAYPVRYYNPQGMDATVYVPKPDLRFTNNTPGHILIQTKIEGTELKFEFYGTSDGRSVAIEGPRITERSPEGGLKAFFVQKVSDREGNIFIDDTFSSSYDSPDKYPHPGQEPALTKKPSGWSDGEWKRYKKEHGMS